MEKYMSLAAWQRAHALVLLVLRSTDASSKPRSWAVFDQLKRAAISIEANIVEGYALSTRLNFRRHLRIALGSAAETECLVRISAEMDYFPKGESDAMKMLLDGVIRALFGLIRKSG
jgi:four helix bundle protein